MSIPDVSSHYNLLQTNKMFQRIATNSTVTITQMMHANDSVAMDVILSLLVKI